MSRWKAPERMTMPRDTPIPRPENTVQSHTLSVNATFANTRSKIPRAIGYTKVLMTVVVQRFPRISSPIINMATLNASTKPEIEVRKLCQRQDRYRGSSGY